MRPILLQSHTRALTKVRFNAEGDLLFSSSKDSEPHVWRSGNGELLGTFVGHSGVVWTLDPSHDTRQLLTGSGDASCKIWDCSTGKCLMTLREETGVRCVDWAQGSKEFLLLTDRTMGHSSCLKIYDATTGGECSKATSTAAALRTLEFPLAGPKPTIARFSDCNRQIFIGFDNGLIAAYDFRSLGASCKEQQQPIMQNKVHDGAITDFQFAMPDRAAFITSSKDFTARLWDAQSLQPVKTYSTERPVNSAAIHPSRDEVMLGGGQEAMQVTTTAARTGKFEVRFFDAVLQEELGRVKGHFGPINTVAYHPLGTGFASGAEDGYVRLHQFDADYYDFSYE